MIKNFKVGEYTLVTINSLAMCVRREIKVRSILDPIRLGYRNELLRLGTYALRSKRKEYYFDLQPGTLVFEGWDVPFKVDTDRTISRRSVSGYIIHTMRGNACYNFVGDEETIKNYLLTKQVNEDITETDLAKAILTNGENEKLIFPDFHSDHAVISRMKNAAEVSK